MRATILLIFACLFTAPVRAAGQDDILANARAAATSGRRDEALSMLDAHLTEAPRDVDARLLYGLVLSWEGRYDEARPVLWQVLTQAPGYTDARVALMNVEYWSGNSTEALEQAHQILVGQPGNVTARAVRDRIDAANRPWSASTTYTLDAFDDGTEPWQEVSASLTRQTGAGSLIARWNHARRFGLQDDFVEAEFYPRFRPGTYAFIGAGVAPESARGLYPQYRVAFDLYQSLGRGFEASGGARYLDFSNVTQIYLFTLTKYVGNWMWTGKLYYVPGEGELHSNTYAGGFRRYVGADGTSYFGLTYSHGWSREVRSLEDLATFNSETIRGEFDVFLGSRTRFSGSAGVSQRERPNRLPVWQTTIATGLSVHF